MMDIFDTLPSTGYCPWDSITPLLHYHKSRGSQFALGMPGLGCLPKPLCWDTANLLTSTARQSVVSVSLALKSQSEMLELTAWLFSDQIKPQSPEKGPNSPSRELSCLSPLTPGARGWFWELNIHGDNWPRCGSHQKQSEIEGQKCIWWKLKVQLWQRKDDYRSPSSSSCLFLRK